jgi:hypothetical protein
LTAFATVSVGYFLTTHSTASRLLAGSLCHDRRDALG